MFIQISVFSRKKSKVYTEWATKVWNIGVDEWNLFNEADILEVHSLSLDEPELKAALFNDIGEKY